MNIGRLVLKLAAGAVLASAFFGCIPNDHYTRQTDSSWRQNYRGFPPKFMKDPGYVLPQYQRFK